MTHGEPLTILTYNLLHANASDEHPWSQRRPTMTRLLNELGPSLIGTQEGLDRQLTEITDTLDRPYRRVGTSRLGSTEDEYSAILVDEDRFEVGAVAEQWISTTPDVPGSISWGHHPRMFTAVDLVERSTGTSMLMINTHLDYWSLVARRHGAEAISEHVRTYAEGRPVVLTGDFNTGAHQSAAYQRLIATPLADVFDVAAHPGPERPSYNDHQPPPDRGPRIDWILVSPDVVVDDCRVVTQDIDGLYGSDHLPIEATIRLPLPQERASCGVTWRR